MTAQHGDRLVADYLARLNAALASAPPDRREEISGEIASHIVEERAKLADETDTDVLNLLDRIGDPSELAGAAQATSDPGVTSAPVRPWGAVEVCALIFTPLFWPVGVILLWLSPAWKVRDKVIGTLLPPGGYITVVTVLPLALFQGVSTCTSYSDGAGNSGQTCTGLMAQPEWVQIVVGIGLLLGVVLLILLPVLTAIYLAVQLRRGADSGFRVQNDPPHAASAWTDGPTAIT